MFASRISTLPSVLSVAYGSAFPFPLTLFALSGSAFLLGRAIPASLVEMLEFAVGVMLFLLGAQALFALWQSRLHLHAHVHGSEEEHVHLHSHAGETARHEHSSHAHAHGFRWRTLLVGCMHGMAGSAALLLLAMAQVKDPVRGLAYVLVFGVGSMIGMGALSVLLSVPLSLSARFVGWANNGLRLAIGCGTVGLGIATMIKHAP